MTGTMTANGSQLTKNDMARAAAYDPTKATGRYAVTMRGIEKKPKAMMNAKKGTPIQHVTAAWIAVTHLTL